MDFWIGWTIGFLTGGAGLLCLASLRIATRCSAEDDDDGIQDDFTPAIARWTTMGRRWGWL